MVELHNVRIKYPTGNGVDRITLHVAHGEMVFLVGSKGKNLSPRK